MFFDSLTIHHHPTVGAIDVHELRQVMQKMHIHLSHRELMDTIHSVDADGNGTLEFEEFLVLMQSRVGEGGPDENLRKAFLRFDKDGTGFISKDNVRDTMIEFDNPLTEEELNAIFHEVDLNNDGRITFREFRHLMVSRCLIGV